MDSPTFWQLVSVALTILVCYLAFKLWDSKKGREAYEVKCQQEIMKVYTRIAEASDDQKLMVSGRMEELRVQMFEAARARDAREAALKTRIDDLERVMKARFRYES